MNRSSGLTLIELMATLALGGLLMVAAMGAVSSMSRSGKLAQKVQKPWALEDSLKNMLETDVLNAKQYRKTSSGFELRTYASLDRGSLAMKHLPATVAYEVRPAGPGTMLVRTQRDDEGKAFTELASLKVASIVMTTDSNNSKGGASGDWKAVGDAPVVTAQAQGQELIRIVLRIR